MKDALAAIDFQEFVERLRRHQFLIVPPQIAHPRRGQKEQTGKDGTRKKGSAARASDNLRQQFGRQFLADLSHPPSNQGIRELRAASVGTMTTTHNGL